VEDPAAPNHSFLHAMACKFIQKSVTAWPLGGAIEDSKSDPCRIESISEYLAEESAFLAKSDEIPQLSRYFVEVSHTEFGPVHCPKSCLSPLSDLSFSRQFRVQF
jgi:hypothetical protein